MKIKAIVFDMDGVLIDAKEWHYEALNKALHLFGVQISRYDHLVTYDGLPTKKKLEMLTKEQGLSEKLHSFINEMKQQYTMDALSSRVTLSLETTLYQLYGRKYRLLRHLQKI